MRKKQWTPTFLKGILHSCRPTINPLSSHTRLPLSSLFKSHFSCSPFTTLSRARLLFPANVVKYPFPFFTSKLDEFLFKDRSEPDASNIWPVWASKLTFCQGEKLCPERRTWPAQKLRRTASAWRAFSWTRKKSSSSKNKKTETFQMSLRPSSLIEPWNRLHVGKTFPLAESALSSNDEKNQGESNTFWRVKVKQEPWEKRSGRLPSTAAVWLTTHRQGTERRKFSPLQLQKTLSSHSNCRHCFNLAYTQ